MDWPMRRTHGLLLLLGISAVSLVLGAYVVFVAKASVFPQAMAEQFFFQDLIAWIGVLLVCAVGTAVAKRW